MFDCGVNNQRKREVKIRGSLSLCFDVERAFQQKELFTPSDQKMPTYSTKERENGRLESATNSRVKLSRVKVVVRASGVLESCLGWSCGLLSRS